MSTGYTLRPAAASDLATLVAFTVQEATETEGAPDLEAVERGVRMGLDGSAPVSYWLSESPAGEAAGSISVVREWSNFRAGYYWWVQSLFVRPEHRGRGLVDELLELVAAAARAAGALDLRLYALHTNARALAAYRRCGFSEAPYVIMVRGLDRR